MGLVYRNGRPYLYRSVRRNGRVTSEYCGSGQAALCFAVWDADDRAEREHERAECDAERKRSDALAACLDDYCGQVEALARSALYAAGYHYPKRTWRKRHGGNRER